MMEYQEFLEKLKATPRDWYLESRGQIRFPADGQHHRPHCPYNRVFNFPNMRSLPTTHNLWIDITATADGWDRGTRMRAELLAACGLTEVA